MISQEILDSLPDLYRNIFPRFFEELIPVETYATCSDCAMCSKPNEPQMPGVNYYSVDAKCCTFFPKLSNYLVGGILTDATTEMEEGRRRILKIIESRVGVNPYGIFPPKKYSILHKHGSEKSFGKNQSMLCPYYVRELGTCSVWKFRESICTTYYCKSVTGLDGKKFWNTLNSYLLHAQETLILHALYKLDWPMDPIMDFLNTYNSITLEASDLDEKPLPDELYSKIWGDWTGREVEFFRRTYQIVQEVSREEFEQISGMNQKVYLKWLKQRRQGMLSPQIPKLLIRNPDLRSMPLGDEKYMVRTEAGFFQIESGLYEVLDLFDGKRSTEEVARIVEEEWDDTLRDDLLIPMFQNKMLLPA